MRILQTFLLFLFSIAACAQITSPDAWKQFVPSDALPKNVKTRSSNNNLDVIRHNGRYYFAFRTAPTHFASRKTRLYILSSPDAESWVLEHVIHHGADLREPRFTEHDGRLFFCYFEGSKSPFSFNPQHIWMTELSREKGWSASKNIGLDGYVPWRIRARNDTLFLSAYYGKGIYSSNHRADLRLFISTNGYDWQPLTEQPQVDRNYSEEGEFIFDKQGNLWATVRIESEGALIVCAERDKPGEWYAHYTEYKYDSALMFEHDDEIYVISRRNVDGKMQRNTKRFSENFKKRYNLVRYWLTTKKTALFRLNKDKMELEHLVDFPSTGDTAFPGIVKLDDGSYMVFNYSSNIWCKNRNWFAGQLGKTYIYKAILKLTPSGIDVSFID